MSSKQFSKRPELGDYGLTDDIVLIITDITTSVRNKEDSLKTWPRIIAILSAIGLIYLTAPLMKGLGLLPIVCSIGVAILLFYFLISTDIFISTLDSFKNQKFFEHRISSNKYNEWNTAYIKYTSDLYKYEQENRYKNKYNYYPKNKRYTPKYRTEEKVSFENLDLAESKNNPFQNSWNDDRNGKLVSQKLEEVLKKAEKPNVELSNPFSTYFVKSDKFKEEENKKYVVTGRTSIEEFLIPSERKKIGDEGEFFVIEYEKQKLKYHGLDHLIEKIVHVSVTEGDSKGFDIFSFDEDGKEILIEVKTTLGDIYSSFFITDNELRTRKSCSNYFIYRVYGFEREKKTGKIFVINPEIKIDEYFKSEAKVFKLTPNKFESKK